jgi:hypothetical protein
MVLSFSKVQGSSKKGEAGLSWSLIWKEGDFLDALRAAGYRDEEKAQKLDLGFGLRIGSRVYSLEILLDLKRSAFSQLVAGKYP